LGCSKSCWCYKSGLGVIDYWLNHAPKLWPSHLHKLAEKGGQSLLVSVRAGANDLRPFEFNYGRFERATYFCRGDQPASFDHERSNATLGLKWLSPHRPCLRPNIGANIQKNCATAEAEPRRSCRQTRVKNPGLENQTLYIAPAWVPKLSSLGRIRKPARSKPSPCHKDFGGHKQSTLCRVQVGLCVVGVRQ
jgi:hypothetical protein